MNNKPLVSWYEGTNEFSKKVDYTVNYGTVDASSPSPKKTFFIWNNRGGQEDCPKMEEVTFTTRDRDGGTTVEAVRDNWFRVRVDSLGETDEKFWTEVGKGGVDTKNPTGLKDIGTNGTTTNKFAETAQVWSSLKTFALGAYVKPTTPNGYIYKVINAGETSEKEPSWLKVEGNTFFDNSIEYLPVKIEKTPNAKEILGLANNTKEDGSNAHLAGGNFVQITVYAEVPVTASAGKNSLVQRVSYRYV
ncbi:hypothetical protein PVA17_07380 [Lysinibacillus sp. CNPSo 3705]|uniref:hypothetical protein n=1 Tax=Lysinibacillus sp. CNPSo 3705 TaxID=3028148 RepID=UPI0023633CDD|nr:hypothetical protein [Lysinibacillus sp. CNPSo 3705]MDD1502588.1 hypothetical protein [Lysinibacillus sp. CNPSo 3705]